MVGNGEDSSKEWQLLDDVILSLVDVCTALFHHSITHSTQLTWKNSPSFSAKVTLGGQVKQQVSVFDHWHEGLG